VFVPASKLDAVRTEAVSTSYPVTSVVVYALLWQLHEDAGEPLELENCAPLSVGHVTARRARS
jgi:hypothetical protein